ncbi:ribonuclease HI [Desulfopila sp. IMCC35008]|uniref:ribonuclease HI n=1 Tax=Desulfopila sp. IMCC35008 TaxID=2653858 RepID=UPI0013D5E94D|nr:ribonuclease HI [Desulfopila sp. IMCC35008]
MAKKKYYAVADGRQTGVYTDWPTAEKQVKGYGGAKFKSFPTRDEAESWLKDPQYSRKNNSEKVKKQAAGRQAAPVPPGSIVIYTDGGAINNPGPGGYGIIICDGAQKHELSGGFRMTTNNRMEMTAAIRALREVKGTTKQIVLYSDSSYLVNGIEKGWARKWQANGWRKADKSAALNSDLWAELLELMQDIRVEFRWVKGHAGNELNERCDKLAVSSARQPGLPIDHGYEAK